MVIEYLDGLKTFKWIKLPRTLQPISHTITLDESFDTMSFKLITEGSLKLLPNTIVRVNEYGTNEFFVVDTFNRAFYGYNYAGKKQWLCSISLVEATSLLSGIYMGNFSVITHGKAFSVSVGLFRRLRAIAGGLRTVNDSLKYSYASISLDYRLSSFFNFQCPEMNFTQTNVLEVLIEVGKMKSCFPKISDISNYGTTHETSEIGFTVTYEFLDPYDIIELPNTKFNSFEAQQSLSNYANEVTVYANNVSSDYGRKIQFPGRCIAGNWSMPDFEPPTYYATNIDFGDSAPTLSTFTIGDVVLKSLKEIIPTIPLPISSLSTSAVITLPFPVNRGGLIIPFWYQVPQYDTTGALKIEGRLFDSTVAGEDNTKFLVSEEEWSLLPMIGATFLGQQTIIGERGKYRETTAYYARGKSEVRNIAALGSANSPTAPPADNVIMNTLYNVNACGYTAPAVACTGFMFYIEYEPMCLEGTRYSAFEYTPGELPYTVVRNFSSNFIQDKYLSGRINGEVKQLHNGDAMYTVKNSIGTEPNKKGGKVQLKSIDNDGTMQVEMYTITSIQRQIYASYYACSYMLSKGYNRKNLRVAVDKQIRVYNIPVDGGHLNRTCRWVEVISMSLNPARNKSKGSFLNTMGRCIAMTPFCWYIDTNVFDISTNNGTQQKFMICKFRPNDEGVDCVLSAQTSISGQDVMITAATLNNRSAGRQKVEIQQDLVTANVQTVVGGYDIIYTTEEGNCMSVDITLANQLKAYNGDVPLEFPALRDSEYWANVFSNTGNYQKKTNSAFQMRYMDRPDESKVRNSLNIDKDAGERVILQLLMNFDFRDGIFGTDNTQRYSGFWIDAIQRASTQLPPDINIYMGDKLCPTGISSLTNYKGTPVGGTTSIVGGWQYLRFDYTNSKFHVEGYFPGGQKCILFCVGDSIIWGINYEAGTKGQQDLDIYVQFIGGERSKLETNTRIDY